MPGIFDIIGPVMIGPSSSHTAGAARLGRMARFILGERPTIAILELHGSFAKTCQGHGTDKALVAGLLGYREDDLRIKESLNIAEREQLKVDFRAVDLGDVHPNTVVLKLTSSTGRVVKVVGSSVGGGNILISQIDGFAVELKGEYDTLISIHQDRPGVIALITKILAQNDVNIAFMRVSRQEKGSQALAIIEADQTIAEQTLVSVRAEPAVEFALLVPPL